LESLEKSFQWEKKLGVVDGILLTKPPEQKGLETGLK
jgi:hypothetical protein